LYADKDVGGLNVNFSSKHRRFGRHGLLKQYSDNHHLMNIVTQKIEKLLTKYYMQ